MSKIKLIMFDLGNVLLKEKNEKSVIYDDIGKKLASISYDSVFDDEFKRNLKEISKEYNVDEYFLKERLLKYFRDVNDFNMKEQEFQSLAIKYKLGIASNYISDIYNILTPFHQYLSITCISGAMGVEKPDKQFFNKIIDEASYNGIFNNEILFIDDKQENLQSARELGINTLYYNNRDLHDKSLFEIINDFIDEYERKEEKIIIDNTNKNLKINKNVPRNKEILKNKFDRQRVATFNEICVGALPVLDTYGFKPTEPQPNGLEKLKELSAEEMYFESELQESLNLLETSFSQDDLIPIYILLSYGATIMGKLIKTSKKEPYSHGSISFDSELKSLYSFTGKGFVHENIKDPKTYGKTDKYKYSLYTIFVNKKQFKSMGKYLEFIKSNADKISYSIKGCINNLFNKPTPDKDKFFCSQFVAEVIKQANENIVSKDPSLYSPYDLRKLKGCFFLQKGFLKNYNPIKTKQRIEDIKKKITDETIIEETFRDYLKTGKNGSLIVRYTKMDYKEEYNKSHRLLKIYRTTKDLESIKEEIAKLWSYYLIIEKIYIQEAKTNSKIKQDKKYKDAVIAKAFILGDVKDYVHFIKNNEPTFNFSEYYEESKYNKDALIITREDMKKIISLIKKII